MSSFSNQSDQTTVSRIFEGFFDKLPVELRIAILEEAVKTSWFFDFRATNRQFADESLRLLYKYGVYRITTIDHNKEWIRPLSNEQIRRIQNVSIELAGEARMKESHQFSDFWLQTLQDEDNLIRQFHTQGVQRNHCHITAECRQNVFELPNKVLHDLQDLKDFATVSLDCIWNIEDRDPQPKKSPFTLFRLQMESGLGPAELVSCPEDIHIVNLRFRPRAHFSLPVRLNKGRLYDKKWPDEAAGRDALIEDWDRQEGELRSRVTESEEKVLEEWQDNVGW